MKVKARRYPAKQRAFLNKYVDRLVEFGFFIPNPDADWQAAPLLVPKRNSKADFRLAIDLRPFNSATIRKAWPMPHLESELLDFAGSECFASLDFCHGYWQLPLAPESYSACGVVCPQGTYSATRALPGLTNATSYFQSTVEPLFQELRSSMKAWLDDFNLHSKTETELLHLLERFFDICSTHNLFLSARKCEFFTKRVRWCGRVINKDGYQLDPARIEGLRAMDVPRTADEVCEFVHSCRWMSLSIPDFARRVEPLVELLEKAYAKSGRRTKRSIKNISLKDLSWGAQHEQTFLDLQESLKKAVAVAFPRPGHTLCVYTDASERFWSGIVSQTTEDELKKPYEEQRHEPLAFLGGAFRDAELNWSTFEREGFAIFQTFEKLDYLFLDDHPVHIFTDHRNLLFTFAPLALQPKLARHTCSKVYRWATFLSRFDYVIEHIEGPRNVFADMLTRWTRRYRGERLSSKKVCSLVLAPSQTIYRAEDLSLPSADLVIRAQAQGGRPPKEAAKGKDGIFRIGNAIWVPEKARELQLRALVAAHCGHMGHRGGKATASILREHFTWRSLADDVALFVRNCLLCLFSKSGDMIPRPLGQALHGTRPNEVLHLDYLYMGASFGSERYLLIIRDDLSGYVWLWPTASASSEDAADALASWISAFGAMEWIVSDRGSHFKNSLIRHLVESMHINHHFTTAYCPWANGTVERVCKEVLRAARVLLHELRLGEKDWPAVTECLTSILNHSPLTRLGLRSKKQPGVYRSPLEVFTSHRPTRPLLRALPFDKYASAPTLDIARAQQCANMEQIQDSMDKMHKEVSERVNEQRKKAVMKHNERTGVIAVNFAVRDFVLVRRPKTRQHKLQYSWQGPRRVVGVKSEWVYEVEDLIRKKREYAHASRMILYRGDLDDQPVSDALLQLAERTETSYQDVHALRNIRKYGTEIQILVEWEGLNDTQDLTWKPVTQLWEDVPGILEDFLNSTGDRPLKRRALDLCNLK